VVRARATLRRAAPAALAAAVVVVVLANVRPRPEVAPVKADALPRPAPGHEQEVRRVSTRRASRPGPRHTAAGPLIATPFSVIQVKVTLTGRELTRVETVALTGENARTQALNAHAEPILRREALRAGSADIDVVTGATYTSESYIDSLQAALDRARARAGR
jgi:uncharacterized protein with FMN-binding domain